MYTYSFKKITNDLKVINYNLEVTNYNIIIIIIIIPNIPPESRVWVRKDDGQSIPVLYSQGRLEESGRFYKVTNYNLITNFCIWRSRYETRHISHPSIVQLHYPRAWSSNQIPRIRMVMGRVWPDPDRDPIFFLGSRPGSGP